MSLQEATRYQGISAKAYEHPADRAATAALRSIPLLDKAVKYLSDVAHERLVRQLYIGNAVQVSDRQVPLLWARHVQAASVLDVAQVPDLFVTQMPDANAVTIGAKRPMVVVLSGLVRDYTGSEVDTVLAHEMGHVLSEHNYYQTALQFLRQIIQNTTGVPMFGPGLPFRGCFLRAAGMVEGGRTFCRPRQCSRGRRSSGYVPDADAAGGRRSGRDEPGRFSGSSGKVRRRGGPVCTVVPRLGGSQSAATHFRSSAPVN